jgi:hypothetical protein
MDDQYEKVREKVMLDKNRKKGDKETRREEETD